MKYQIHITKSAKRDMESAADYIEYSLKNPSAADELLDLAEKKILALAHFPEKHPIIDDPILSIWEIRLVTVKNYIVFYKIIDDTIFIIRFLYGMRNWKSILMQEINLD